MRLAAAVDCFVTAFLAMTPPTPTRHREVAHSGTAAIHTPARHREVARSGTAAIHNPPLLVIASTEGARRSTHHAG